MVITFVFVIEHKEETMMVPGKRIVAIAAGLWCALLMAAHAQAAFQVVEDFDSLVLAPVNGQNGWFATPGSGLVVLDPVNTRNQVLQVITESGILHRAAVIDQAATRMLFMRLRFEEHCEFSFGLSHLANPSEHSHFGPELGMAPATENDPANDFRVANGLLPIGTYDVVSTLLPDTWYNIWVLVDNGAKTYQVWINSTPGGNANSTDQLTNSSGEDLFGFRTATNRDLVSFFIKTGCGASPIDGRFYLDDIYLEDTGEINLTNPATIPFSLPWLMFLLRDEQP
jgi:hypothetical protein